MEPSQTEPSKKKEPMAPEVRIAKELNNRLDIYSKAERYCMEKHDETRVS